jgi:hypothetical protein
VDPLQGQHERWVSDQVIQRYNVEHGTSFRFYGRAGVVLDLEYREGSRCLRVEVVTAYYDAEDAKFKWLAARKRDDARNRSSGVDFDKSLVENINSALDAKCAKSYGPNCVLAVCILPDLTFAEEMESLLDSVSVPSTNRFEHIHLCGEFPAQIGRPAERGI